MAIRQRDPSTSVEGILLSCEGQEVSHGHSWSHDIAGTECAMSKSAGLGPDPETLDQTA